MKSEFLQELPRTYQLRLLQQAKDGNVIAVLNTGSGKTLIAVMLIRLSLLQASSQFKAGIVKNRKICVFLVPAVPLVNQQAEYLRYNCNFRVTEVYGAMGVDQWGKRKWQDVFIESDVIVMTPQILVNSLNAAYFGLEAFSLIIFDEAHHARKNHPYNHVMEIYRHARNEAPDSLDLPKIFGMTASPSCSTKSEASESIRTLEQNLNSQAFTVDLEDLTELNKYVPRPKEEVLYYPPGNFSRVPKLYQLFLDCNGHGCKVIGKYMDDCLQECDEFGTWWGSRALEYAYCSITRNALNLKSKGQKKQKVEVLLEEGEVDETTDSEEVLLCNFYDAITDKLKTNLEYLPMNHETLKRTRQLIPRVSFQVPEPDISELSPKLQKLFELLETYRDTPDFCGIIFVEKRNAAQILSDCIQHSSSLNTFLRPALLVGHGDKSKSFGSQMVSKEQGRIVKAFREKAYNLLIATKIGEEGIDIQACILVVRLSLFQTLVDYIQSRGRARHHSSRYIVFLEEGNIEKQKHYLRTVEKEEEMNQALMVKADDWDEDEEAATNLLSSDEIYVHSRSGARLTVFNAPNILQKYCAVMPKDAYCSSNPTYIVNGSLADFSADIYLPLTVPPDCRVIKGPTSANKNKARRNAAFLGVKLLLENGELDDRFRPAHIRVDEDGKVQPTIQRIGATKIRSFHAGIADVLRGDWATTTHIYLSMINVEVIGDRTPPQYAKCTIDSIAGKTFKVGIVTIERLQEDQPSFVFELPVREDLGNLGIVLRAGKPIPVSEATLISIRHFHTQMMGAFLRKALPVEADWGYMFSPILIDNGIPNFDMDVLRSVENAALSCPVNPITFRDILTGHTDAYDVAIAAAIEERNLDVDGAVAIEAPTIAGNSAKAIPSTVEDKAEVGIEMSAEPLNIVAPIPPNFSHPYEGTFLESLRNKKYASQDHIKENVIVTDGYYYGRKYQVIEIIDSISPFDKVPRDLVADNSMAQKYFKTLGSVAAFYKVRLRCWETIRPDQPIIKALQIPHFAQPNRMMARYSDQAAKQADIDLPPFRNNKRLSFVYLLPQFCFEYPVSRISLLEDGLLLPLISRQLDHALHTRDFQKQFDLHFIPRFQIQCAFTTPSSHQPYDYERLENLGDSFLKILITLHIFSKYPTYHEGRLTSIRNHLEGNRLFTKKAVQTGLLGAILCEPLTRMLWTPLIRQYQDEIDLAEEGEFWAVDKPEGTIKEDSLADVKVDKVLDEQSPKVISTIVSGAAIDDMDVDDIKRQVSLQTGIISDKTIADCMEALVGASVEAESIVGGSKVANVFLSEGYEVDWIAGYGKMLRDAGFYGRPKGSFEDIKSSLVHVEKAIGYTFKNPNILIESLTHPSAVDVNGGGSCYQRLEFLGDAALHYVVTLFVYSKYPLLSPGSLSEYRSSLVNNQFLSCVCGALGIHKSLNHNSIAFTTPMVGFGKMIDRILENYRHMMGDPDGELDTTPEIINKGKKASIDPRTSHAFWNDMEEAPKAVADVYEAILGAVLVDSMDQPEGTPMSLDAVRSVVERTLLKPWLPIIGPPSSIQVHPVKELVDFFSTIQCRELKIRVLFHDISIGEGDAATKRLARKNAANAAISYAKDNRPHLITLCSCDNTAVIADLEQDD